MVLCGMVHGVECIVTLVLMVADSERLCCLFALFYAA